MPFDIHIEGVPVGEVSGMGFLSFGDYPQVVGVRGIHKLVAQFLKCMLTPKGTDISDPDYGTDLAEAFQGNIDSSILGQLASRAVTDTVETLREYHTEYIVDDDERIAGADILDVQVDEDAPGVSLTIRVTNIEGTKALFLVSSVEESNGN